MVYTLLVSKVERLAFILRKQRTAIESDLVQEESIIEFLENSLETLARNTLKYKREKSLEIMSFADKSIPFSRRMTKPEIMNEKSYQKNITKNLSGYLM